MVSRAKRSASVALRTMSPVGRFSTSTAARPTPFLDLHPTDTAQSMEKGVHVPPMAVGRAPSDRTSYLSTASSEVDETKVDLSSRVAFTRILIHHFVLLDRFLV